MSLLLDALKKAEQEKAEKEKQRASEAESREKETEINSELLATESKADDLELVLDEVYEEPVVEKEEPKQVEKESLASPSIALEKNTATTTTVSDEALQLLVYKTNKKYRQRQKLVWGGLLSVALIVMLTAGAYYYFGMLDEVAALERKHKLAMRSVNVEPIAIGQPSHKISVPTEAQTLSSGSSEKSLSKNKSRSSVSASGIKKSSDISEYSIHKTQAQDPINALLRAAWLAYNKSDYATASRAYEKVLVQEPSNRDAILGVSAIAFKKQQYKKAKAGYQLLLKLNPRDQVAVAAMTNIDEVSLGSMDESRLKFLLQQQPSAVHLNFALGNYYARKNRWPEAQSEYFKAWQGASENADYVYNLAVSLDKLGKQDEALRFYKDSLILARNVNISFSKVDVEKRIETILDKQ